MAADFIKINTTNSASATHGALLLQYKTALRSAYELGVRVRAVMRHNFTDGVQNIDWTQLEALFGIPNGQGVNVFTLIDGSVGGMEGSFQTSAAKDLTEKLG